MKTLSALVAMACLTSVHAQQHRPHQHGVASLMVSVEGNVLELRLESPLDNLVGFESSPSTPRQHEALRAMVGRFERPERLFAPTVAAGCKAAPVRLASAVLHPDLLKVGSPAPRSGVEAGPTPQESSGSAGAGHPGGTHSEARHADLEAELTFTCTKPEALNGVRVLLFQAFPKLRRIEAQVVTATGQHAARVTAKSSQLSW